MTAPKTDRKDGTMDEATPAQVEAAVAQLREMLRLDGADLRVVGVDGGAATFALELADANCAECVLPAEMIEPILAKALADTVPQVDRVVLRDPRVEGAGQAAP